VGPQPEQYLHTTSGGVQDGPPLVVCPGYGAGTGFFFRSDRVGDKIYPVPWAENWTFTPLLSSILTWQESEQMLATVWLASQPSSAMQPPQQCSLLSNAARSTTECA
jgi:hypothetical protein